MDSNILKDPYLLIFRLLWVSLLFNQVSAQQSSSLVPPSTSASLSSQTLLDNGKDVIASGYYFAGAGLLPSQISWAKFSTVAFAFATTTPNPSNVTLDSQSAALLPQFVSEAHNNNVKALLSIGGAAGSRFFSPAIATAKSRTAFVQAVLDLVNQYKLDGIDFDYEFPNQKEECNIFSPGDTAHFLSFLQQLRNDQTGKQMVVSAAVGLTPFLGPDGNPETDVSAFSDVLDYIQIMNYDIYPNKNTVGPNAPLYDSCAPAAVQIGSASTGVQAWTTAKFPVKKIVLGVPAYSHSYFVDRKTALSSKGKLNLYTHFDAKKQPLGDGDTPGASKELDQCGQPGGISGTFNFNSLIKDGFLNTNGDPSSGMVNLFDDCSKTPFIYQPSSGKMISYDNPKSFAAKGQFILNNSLAGFAIWQVGGDYNDLLVDSISNAMGIVEVCS